MIKSHLEIQPEDMILYYSYKDMGDFIYDVGKVLPPSGSIVFCENILLPEFLLDAAKTDNKYILIVAHGDQSLSKNNIPHGDDMIRFIDLIYPSLRDEFNSSGYGPLHIVERVNMDRCKREDKYALRIYSNTMATFDYMPPNIVKMFITNSMVKSSDFGREEGFIENLPFGVLPTVIPYIIKYRTNPKAWGYTACWTNYTIERHKIQTLMMHLGEKRGFMAYKNDMTHENFIRSMSLFSHCFAPAGNGADCFRSLEAIYLGVKPVLSIRQSDSFLKNNCYCMKSYEKTPVEFVNGYNYYFDYVLGRTSMKNTNNLDELFDIQQNEQTNHVFFPKTEDVDLSTVTKSYWANRISNAKSLIN